jgi:hypothetical protein
MRKKIIATVSALAALALVGGVAAAAVTFNPDDGSGFVGKGDVQTAFGWNNKTLQENAESVEFRVSSEVVTEASWTCVNTNNENEQVRNSTTKTSVSGLIESVSRTGNQVNGFILSGYEGAPTGSSSNQGPSLNSCPSGPWTLDTPAGDPEVISSSGGVYASTDGVSWTLLP